MVNCNPETVSTDYDTSDRLYFEPLDEEAVLAVLEREQPVGVVHPVRRPDAAQARARDRARPASAILGTPFDAIDLAEDRERFGRLARALGVRCPEWGIAGDRRRGGRDRRADRLPGARPARRTCSAGARCASATTRPRCATRWPAVDGAVLVDRFLENAIELDVDALCDGRDTYVAAVMEHVEEAGIHSGDSSCVLPAPSRLREVRGDRRIVRRLGAGARRRRAAERPARDRRRRGLRARGEPARLAHGAVRVEGDRRQPRRRRLPARGRARSSPSSSCRPSAPPAQVTSRRPCCRSRASRAPTPCSARRCARPAR